jgi:DNA mismatch repair protein MutS2
VIHGHGTGALRNAVRAHLRDSPHVRRQRPGNADEGGDGVTHAEIV